jgi:hypothetical protein
MRREDIRGPDGESHFRPDVDIRIKEEHDTTGDVVVLRTTEDRLRLRLGEHLRSHITKVERKKSWATPLGISIALGIVFPTTKFNDFIVDARTWAAVFLIGTSCSLVWLFYSLFQSYRSGKTGNVNNIVDLVVEDLKTKVLPNEKGAIIPPETPNVQSK